MYISIDVCAFECVYSWMFYTTFLDRAERKKSDKFRETKNKLKKIQTNAIHLIKIERILKTTSIQYQLNKPLLPFGETIVKPRRKSQIALYCRAALLLLLLCMLTAFLLLSRLRWNVANWNTNEIAAKKIFSIARFFFFGLSHLHRRAMERCLGTLDKIMFIYM